MKNKKPNSKRIVVKLGTGLVIDNKFALNEKFLKNIVAQIAKLRKKNIEVVLVSSGAIGLAKGCVKFDSNVKKIGGAQLPLEQKQALAAVGQPLLMGYYAKLFSKHKMQVAQVLLTTNDLSQRESYMNLQRVFNELMKQNIIPIVNENDCVSIKEISEGQGKIFGDNDVLSSLVASKLDAEKLVILTDVAGVYDKNPNLHKNAQVISHIKKMSDYPSADLSGTSQHGRGGMATKIKAAQTASLCGVMCVIASGYEKDILLKVASDLEIAGTSIYPQGQLQMRKKWLGFSKSTSGAVVINIGAQMALESKHASLLPVGVIEVRGDFKQGELISILGEDQVEVGRGLSKYASADLKKTMGLQKPAIKNMNPEFSEELVHRDYLVIFKELYSV